MGKNDEGLIIPKIESVNESFLIKEVDAKMKDAVPLCHHKLKMKQILVKNKKCWVCVKPQSEKCTAFQWVCSEAKPQKIIKDDFEIEQRKKFDKIVLLVRIANIIQTSVDIQFDKNGKIIIQFETDKFKYQKTLQLENYNINVDESRFDVNCRNLLIMAIKQQPIETNPDHAINDILNDSTLFEIN